MGLDAQHAAQPSQRRSESTERKRSSSQSNHGKIPLCFSWLQLLFNLLRNYQSNLRQSYFSIRRRIRMCSEDNLFFHNFMSRIFMNMQDISNKSLCKVLTFLSFPPGCVRPRQGLWAGFLLRSTLWSLCSPARGGPLLSEGCPVCPRTQLHVWEVPSQHPRRTRR